MYEYRIIDQIIYVVLEHTMNQIVLSKRNITSFSCLIINDLEVLRRLASKSINLKIHYDNSVYPVSNNLIATDKNRISTAIDT